MRKSNTRIQNMFILYRKTRFNKRFFLISNIKMELRIRLGTAKSLNTLKVKNSTHTTHIFSIKYVSIGFAALNQMLKYTLLRIIHILNYRIFLRKKQLLCQKQTRNKLFKCLNNL